MYATPNLIGYTVHTDRTIIYTGNSLDDWAATQKRHSTASCFALLDMEAETLTVTIVETGETQVLPMDRRNAKTMYYRDLEEVKQAELNLLGGA